LKARSGEEIATAEHGSGTKHLVRLLPYLPGKFVSQVTPHSPDLLRSLGVFLGSMDKAFASFHHPAADRELKWNMKSAPSTIRSRLHHIAAPEGRALVIHFVERFEKQTSLLLSRIREGIIHNDANDNNVLVRQPAPDSGPFDLRVTGIIDFGDMVAGFPVVDLAVGTTYAIMGKTDPLAAAVPVVSTPTIFLKQAETTLLNGGPFTSA